jgi:hypothetical protein
MSIVWFVYIHLCSCSRVMLWSSHVTGYRCGGLFWGAREILLEPLTRGQRRNCKGKWIASRRLLSASKAAEVRSCTRTDFRWLPERRLVGSKWNRCLTEGRLRRHRTAALKFEAAPI